MIIISTRNQIQEVWKIIRWKMASLVLVLNLKKFHLLIRYPKIQRVQNLRKIFNNNQIMYPQKIRLLLC